jgi:hypothetical protein
MFYECHTLLKKRRDIVFYCFNFFFPPRHSFFGCPTPQKLKTGWEIVLRGDENKNVGRRARTAWVGQEHRLFHKTNGEWMKS